MLTSAYTDCFVLALEAGPEHELVPVPVPELVPELALAPAPAPALERGLGPGQPGQPGLSVYLYSLPVAVAARRVPEFCLIQTVSMSEVPSGS